ncbi:Anaphase-promoting complex subunit 4 [Ceratocystis platani]|uniref:Anaphase-promoting complex subunit 4 n=1 Tax=Ceratocystis fimbriata f. sp. platani TaxID=88771 RepID=A0A0F8DKN1_CERFI|nr:Anaphase-promoting complex subunit 4 [Ceratocystis platani]
MSVSQKLRLYSETTYESTLDGSGKNVLVYRPNGEQVCKMQQGARFGGSTVTATRWKPNGQFIAVAWEDGIVRLMNLETSKSAHNIQVLPKDSKEEIQYLAWATTRISLGDKDENTKKAVHKDSSAEETIANLPRQIMFLETDISLPKLSPLPTTSAGSGQTTLHIQVEYSNARDLHTRFLNSVKQSLQEDKRGQHDVVTAFYHATLTGNIPRKMKEWLVDSMGDRGLKRWAKAAIGGLKGIRTLVQQYLIPALERMVIILSRLKGLAQFYNDNDDVGLSVPEIENLVGVVSCLLLVANRIMIFTMEELACFTMFNTWITVTLDKLLSPSTTNEVTEKEVSIQYQKVLLYIVEYLEESPIKHHVNTDAGDEAFDDILLRRPSGQSMIDVLTNILEQEKAPGDAIAEDRKVAHLGHLVGMLDRSIRRVLDSVAAAQERGVRFGETVRMDLGDTLSKMDSRMVAHDRKGSITYTALTTKNDTHKIIFYRTSLTITNGISSTPETQTSTLSLDPGRVIDMKFLNDNVLLALIDPQNNAPCAIYIITLDALVWDPSSSSNTSHIDIPPPLPLPADFVPAAMEVFEASSVRNQLPARVCLLSENRVTWKTFALEPTA